MTDIVALDVASWRPALGPDAQDVAIRTLEGGGVLILPRLPFPLADDEQRFLSPSWSDGRAKNISFDGGKLKGARGSPEELAALGRMVARFATEASALWRRWYQLMRHTVARRAPGSRRRPPVALPWPWPRAVTALTAAPFP